VAIIAGTLELVFELGELEQGLKVRPAGFRRHREVLASSLEARGVVWCNVRGWGTTRSSGSGFRRGVGLGASCWRLGGLRGLLRIGRGFSQELGGGFCRRARRWSAAGDSPEQRRAAGVSGKQCLPLPRRVRSGTAARD
jgi:hypothetical protein